MPIPDRHEFSKGDAVYLRSDHKLWYELRSLEVIDQGQPKLHWIGRSEKLDEFATPDRIRVPKG